MKSQALNETNAQLCP